MSKENNLIVPTAEQLEKEMKRMEKRSRKRAALRNVIFSLIVLAAVIVLVVVLFMPVMKIYGSSMKPTLAEGDVVITIKTSDVKQGDIVGVYWGSKLLIKRVIATENQVVNIDENGNVYVDGQMLTEPYVSEVLRGEISTELPCQVPEGCIFLLGDNRGNSTDSRNASIGCIHVDNIAGKLLFRIWPLNGLRVFW